MPITPTRLPASSRPPSAVCFHSPRRTDASPSTVARSSASAADTHHSATLVVLAPAQFATGIPAAFMVAQAAHESGWGRREIRHADGSPSHNLFGIKAGAGWTGPVAEVTTTEYVDGRAHKVIAKFRAYASAAESFADYARLMRDSPRYQAVRQADSAREFADGLQRAGYATDPNYAKKLISIMQQIG